MSEPVAVVPAARVQARPEGAYLRGFKYPADRAASLAILCALSPVLLVLGLLLAASLRGNPFFIQRRGGYRNREFNLIKFRTMTDERGPDGRPLPDHRRLTRVGRMVRNLSLDELPQLFNILKGDMSFIGPRPFIAEYMAIYTEEERRRHDVRPGITGWAQVNGRNALTWKEKFRLDLQYVESVSLLLDLKILMLTVVKIIRRKDVDQSLEVTMEKYNGSN